VPEPSLWARRTLRGNPGRLRNLRGAHEELGLVLDELDEMAEAARLQAHGHHEHVHRLLDVMAEQAGPTGEDPQEEQARIRQWLREEMSTNRRTS